LFFFGVVWGVFFGVGLGGGGVLVVVVV